MVEGRSYLALHALQPEHNLLRGLRLLVEDGLGLTTITALLAVITTLTLAVGTVSCGSRFGHKAVRWVKSVTGLRGSSLDHRGELVRRGDTYANREAWRAG